MNQSQRKFRSCTFRRHFETSSCKGRFKNDAATTTTSTTNNDINNIATLIDQEELEDILYERAKSFTNAPPEASFSVHHRRGDDILNEITMSNSSNDLQGNVSNSDRKRATRTASTSTIGNEDALATLFEGVVAIGTPVANNQVRGLGGGSGTIQHLACAIDSPFGLALVLAMDADVSSRHTTFRRLIIHEAACCNSPNCLRLLLELGKGTDFLMNKDDDNAATVTNKEGCLGCHQMQGGEDDCMNCLDGDFIHPEKRQKSISCLSNLASCESKQPHSKPRITFLSLLNLIMALIGQIEEKKMTELEAARILLSKARISDVNKEIISVICRVDSRQEANKTSSQTYPQFISFLRETSSSLSNTDGHGNTALHWAAFKNSASCIKLLFEYNADPNAIAESTGWKPLHGKRERERLILYFFVFHIFIPLLNKQKK